ncbi:hypothetical protein MSKU3_0193 [Komagataeibacter oboediens]|nr:hypothetical protein MSKU3_0193 [Komagataeibacter oboediens]
MKIAAVFDVLVGTIFSITPFKRVASLRLQGGEA